MPNWAAVQDEHGQPVEDSVEILGGVAERALAQGKKREVNVGNR